MKKYLSVLALTVIFACNNSSPLEGLENVPAYVFPDTLSEPVDLYIAGGQSNMREFLQAYYAEDMENLTGRKIAVVDCHEYGTRITYHIDPDGMLGQCQLAVDAILAAYPNFTLRGIIFWQGESDATQYGIDYVTPWPGHFTTYINSYRTHYNNPNLPVVFAQLGDYFDTYYNAWDEMKAVQSQYAADHSNDNIVMITTEGTPLVDEVHIGPEGGDTIAQRFADEMINLIP